MQSILDGKVIGPQERKYTISDHVAVYVQNENLDYTLTTLARVQEGEYVFTAWCDKPESEGGRIRVIIAR